MRLTASTSHRWALLNLVDAVLLARFSFVCYFLVGVILAVAIPTNPPPPHQSLRFLSPRVQDDVSVCVRVPDREEEGTGPAYHIGSRC